MAGKEIQYVNPSDLFISGLDTESDSSNDPLYDERIFLSENESLIRNILTYGVQLPVLVREEDNRLFVVDGRQRVRAARAAAKRQDDAGEIRLRVPVIMVHGDDKRVQGIMISTNENREDDGILAKAIKAARMLDMWGDMDGVCTAFGRGRGTLNLWLKLARAIPAVHTAINEGRLSASAGIEIAQLPRAEQDAALEARLEAKAAPASAATTVDPVTKAPRQAQPGVKRSWVQKTFDTEAFKALPEDQQAVLRWIATGEAADDSWMNDFQWKVTKEMEAAEAEKEAKAAEKEETEAEKAARKLEREQRKQDEELRREQRAARKAEKEEKERQKEERRAAAEAAGKRLPGRPRKVVAAASDVGGEASNEDAGNAAAEGADADVSSGVDSDADDVATDADAQEAADIAAEFSVQSIAAPILGSVAEAEAAE